MTKFITSLLKDESGTAVTEWIVAASIMAIAGIVTFSNIADDAKTILGSIASGVSGLADKVPAAATTP
jgi:Flp pilus assembly pilin Flp